MTTARWKCPGPRIHLAVKLLLAAGVVLSGRPARASLTDFNVFAYNGPFPNAITAPGGFYATDYVKVTVAQNDDLRELTGADAVVSFSAEFQPVSYSQCIITGPLRAGLCSGSISYRVTGLVDSGVIGSFTVFNNSIGAFGSTSGLIGMSAGDYTITATAYTSYNGPVAGDILMPSGEAGYSAANFTVQSGFLSTVPEPGTLVLFTMGCLLMAAGWIWRRRAGGGCPLPGVRQRPAFFLRGSAV